MLLRRTILNCRLKTRVAIFALSVIFICCLLVYRALASHITKSRGPDRSHQQRFHSRQRNSHFPVVNNFHNPLQANSDENQEFKKDLAYANLIQIQSETVKNRDSLSAESRAALVRFLATLYPTDWAKAPETDEVALDLKHLLLDHGLESNMSCKQIDNMRLGSSLLQSHSKYVEYGYEGSEESGGSNFVFMNSNRGRNQRREFVIRSSCSDQETKIACMKQVYDAELCAAMGNYRLLREVLLFSVLRHPSILLMKGYCLRGNRVAKRIQEKGVVIVTEVGVPMTASIIEAASWSQRISMALQVGHLLLYLENSPLGSLWFSKLSLRDFVLIRGIIIKLADLDDLEIGHKMCTDDSQCQLPHTNKGGYCKSGHCEGFNQINNLYMAAKEVLQPLLQKPPGKDEENLVTHLNSLDITAAKLVAELQIFFNKYPPEAPLHFVRVGSVFALENKEPHGFPNKVRDDHQIQNIARSDNVGVDEVLSKFIRHNHRNFPGTYDYVCSGSRVSWGCVHTVTSVLEAARLCLTDQQCVAFVAFTTKPESDNLMTVVLKNGSDSTLHVSSGTTLFIRHPQVEGHREESIREDVIKKYEVKKPEKDHVKKSSTEVQNCIDITSQQLETARYNREKKLMTHLGLKGVGEKVWKRSVKRLNMEGQSQLQKAEGGGGRYLANLTKQVLDDINDRVKNVMFISEEGPEVYHMAYAIVYQLDRLLGLFDVPPCVGKQLSAPVVAHYRNNSQWDETFRSLVESDGTLSGIMVAPVPKVMKSAKLTLSSLSAMTTEVVQLSRSERLQLEYILLWWLGRIGYSSNDHQAYKGHFIHFNADKAFVSSSMEVEAFLYHCQFPAVAYKSLACFRCRSKQETSDDVQSAVCFLGGEVIKQTRAMFPDNVEFFIHGMRESDLVDAINSAASSFLHVIDICIKRFGLENVLY